jgi:hypothetical protein
MFWAYVLMAICAAGVVVGLDLRFGRSWRRPRIIDTEEMQRANAAADAVTRKFGAVLAGVCAVIIVAALAWNQFVYMAPEQAEARRVAARAAICSDEENAYLAAKVAMNINLRTPSTAKFPVAPTVIQRVGECSYFITAFVESENAFGKRTRTSFATVVSFHPVTRRWTADNLSVID